MGNSASNANPNRPNANNNLARPDNSRTNSTSPTPGNPHRSLRTKKRSLELPDLASLSLTPAVSSKERDRGRAVTKTQAIAIPTAPQSPFNHYQTAQMQPGTVRNPRQLPSSTDLYVEPSTHQPYPPSRVGGAPRGRQQPISNSRHQQQVSRYQEAYNASHQPLVVPKAAGKPAFVQEVVQSSIPIALGKAMVSEGMDADTKALLLSPEKEDVSSEPVPVKIYWKGGGREVVLARAGDDDWKGRQPMDRESPTSSVWNTTVYLAPGTHHVRFLVDGSWRVAEDLPTAVDDQGSLANYVAVPFTFGSSSLTTTPAPIQAPSPTGKLKIPGQSFWSADSADGEGDTKPDPRPIAQNHAPSQAYTQAKWTSDLPLELIEAAAEEEAYLAASAGQFEQSTGNMRVTGFVPAPNIPPAPSLPRHLDKLILNTKITERPGAHNGTSSPSPSGSGVGSGQAGRRERKERDREREKERDRQRARRANIPPPPPPSEIGGDDDLPAPPSPGLPTQPEETTSSTTTSTATPTPHTSVPATPTAPLSPTQTPSHWQTPSASTSNPSVSVLNSANILGSSSLPTSSMSSSSVPSDRIMPSASRIITIDTANMPAHTDDASVLPVPSHVVLHHLSTSAIKNGVLAVGNTTRYREKYLTTIYYKPT